MGHSPSRIRVTSPAPPLNSGVTAEYCRQAAACGAEQASPLKGVSYRVRLAAESEDDEGAEEKQDGGEGEGGAHGDGGPEESDDDT